MSNGLKNVRVEHSMEVTINIGNFQNARPGYKVSADVEEGVHPDEARKKLKALVERWLTEDVNAIKQDLAE